MIRLMVRSLPILLLAPAIQVSASAPQFVEVAAGAGIRFRHETGAMDRLHYPEIMGAGVILFDCDNDGDLDIYFLNGNFLDRTPDPSITNALYRNDSAPGALKFTDITLEAGVGDPGYGQGGEAADFDGDGDVDLYVSNLGQDVLFRNEGNGRFTKVPIPQRMGWGQTCAAFDYDRDGDLDLFVANYLTYDPLKEPIGTSMVGGKVVKDYRGPQMYKGISSVLLRNDGGLAFTDVTRAVGLYRPDGKGMGTACLDFDGDGWTDIYQANDSMENFLFMNRQGKFEELGLTAGCALSEDGSAEASMGVDVADIDGSGRMNLMVPCLSGEIHTLYRDEWPSFTDISVPCGLHIATRDRTGFSPSFFDYDNDGDQDLFISCGRVRTQAGAVLREGASFEDRYAETPILVENDGKGHFKDISAAAGPYFKATHVGRGTAAGDLDNDGRIDLVVNHAASAPAILLNQTPGGRWITLKLVGRGMNRDAIGSHVVALVAGRTQHHWVRGGGSYLSAPDRRIHLGLGGEEIAERIEVTWPLGKKTVLERVPAGRFLTVQEPEK